MFSMGDIECFPPGESGGGGRSAAGSPLNDGPQKDRKIGSNTIPLYKPKNITSTNICKEDLVQA